MNHCHRYYDVPNPYLTPPQPDFSRNSTNTLHHTTDLPLSSYHTQDTTNPCFQRSLQTIPIDLSSLVLQAPLCLPCTGKRYNFTAYFHNPNIFKSPPHELLNLVERAYILRNRLQTLLVSYAVHLAFDRSWQEVVLEIDTWSTLVDDLVVDVAVKTKNEKLSPALENVQIWSAEIIGQLKRHVRGVERLVMPKGRSRELGSDFRKMWERVWVASTCHSTSKHSFEAESAT